jgi:Arc/MetJ-type ribon-helix-helix transcriptional regulator
METLSKHFTLTKQTWSLLEDQVSQGRFKNASEAIQHAVWTAFESQDDPLLMLSRLQPDKVELKATPALEQALREGEDSGYADLTPEMIRGE